MSETTGPYRRYLGVVIAAFGIGVLYVVVAASLTISNAPDPSKPFMGALDDSITNAAIFGVLGLSIVPLGLYGVYVWAHQVLGVERGVGCVSIVVAALCGAVTAFLAGAALS